MNYDELLVKLKGQFSSYKFTDAEKALIERIGEVYEQDGVGVTKAFILSKIDEEDENERINIDLARSLLIALDLIKDCPQAFPSRPVGMTTLKAIPNLNLV